MDKFNQDLDRLLSASQNAINVLRHSAEQLETALEDSTLQRDALNRLNKAVHMVEYRIAQREGVEGPFV